MRTIADIGEKKVIEIVKMCLDLPDMPVPFGDDVSGVNIDEDRLAVVKMDMLVGKTDVPPGMSLRQAARKTVVMNVSDFAAKGVQPLAVMVSLGLPRTFTEKDVKQIGLGLNEGAREYGSNIIGGDTNEASDLVISCSALGFCSKHLIVRRSGARVGDFIAVTGTFGKTTAGLKILLEDLSLSERIRKPLIETVLNPKARLKEGLALARAGAVTASIDSSDSLACSLHELSEASSLGFNIENLPIAPEALEFANELSLNPHDLALYGGEEYELVVTVRPEHWNEARRTVRGLGSSLTRIGKTIEGKTIQLAINGKVRSIERRGWEHFKS